MRFRLPRRAISAAWLFFVPFYVLFFALCALLAAAALRPFPEDVSIEAFTKPAGHKLQLLVRVPMAISGCAR